MRREEGGRKEGREGGKEGGGRRREGQEGVKGREVGLSFTPHMSFNECNVIGDEFTLPVDCFKVV